MLTFQQMLLSLLSFWEKTGCLVQQGYDLEVGAGTLNPATFLRALGKEPFNTAYVEPSRRPKDGRYGMHPNRLQNYHQLQVILKPCPKDFQSLYLQSLSSIGLNLKEHDIRFVHDDWENPTIGAWGLGWEVWLNGMEISQITYFQAVGSQLLEVISGEITYGIERIAMYLQGKDSVFDIMWNKTLTYGDIVSENEKEWSYYNFEEADTHMWFRHFDDFSREAEKLIEKQLPIPAYDFVIKSSHAFNILDARGCISVTERTRYITRIRNLAKLVAESYIEKRKSLNYPLFSPEEKQNNENSSLQETQNIPLSLTGTASLLIEIGVEELPDSFISIGISSFKNSLILFFEEHALSYKCLNMFSTPRRLACLVEDLAMSTSPKNKIKKGPALNCLFTENDSVSEQGHNFFKTLNINIRKKNDLSLFPEIFIQKIKNTEYIFINKDEEKQHAAQLIQDNLAKIMSNIHFPKKMLWDSSHFSFARPVRWLVVMMDNYILPVSIHNILSDNISYGHRQLNNNASFVIPKATDYECLLNAHFVTVDYEKRKQRILNDIAELEKKYHFKAIHKEQLITKVVNLTEFPQVCLGSFNEKFCSLPKEILIAEMVEHQKYFPLVNKDDEIINSFIIVADNKPNATIVKGNEKALEPRLTDGVFLFEEDLKTPPPVYFDKLKTFIFFEKLGSVLDKTNRLQTHLTKIYDTIPLSPIEDIKDAVTFSKIDLVSNIVTEFPELQGIMGYYYVRNLKQYSENTAQAIKEHHLLITKNTYISSTGSLLSVLDRIDNILSCFLLDLKATSSNDPYALRRQAIELIWLFLKNKISVDFYDLLRICIENFPEHATTLVQYEDICSEIRSFIVNRFKVILTDLHYSKDLIAAVLPTNGSQFYLTENKIIVLSRLIEENNPTIKELIQVTHRIRKLLSKQNDYNDSDTFTMPPKILETEHRILNVLQEIHDFLSKDNNLGSQEKCLMHVLMLHKLYLPLEELFNNTKILTEDVCMQQFRMYYLKKSLFYLDNFCLFDAIQTVRN